MAYTGNNTALQSPVSGVPACRKVRRELPIKRPICRPNFDYERRESVLIQKIREQDLPAPGCHNHFRYSLKKLSSLSNGIASFPPPSYRSVCTASGIIRSSLFSVYLLSLIIAA